mgnify:CR=1 FL=1
MGLDLAASAKEFPILACDVTREADVVKLDILVAEEPVAAFARIVARRNVEREAENAVEKLHGILPQQWFVVKIQGKALGRIISSRSLSAL